MSITVSTLLAYVEVKTQAGVGTLNNTTTGVPMLNEALLGYRSTLIEKGIDASQTQEAYIATVTVPTYPNTSTFAYPSDMFALKTIEVNMTDTNPMNYIQAQILDVANTPFNQSMDWLRANQDKNTPFFDDRGDTYEIFPTFAVGMNLTNAIKLIYFLDPIPYVNLSDVLVYPDTLDWYLLAEDVAAIYYDSLSKANEADRFKAKADKRTAKIVRSLERGSEQPIQPTNSYPTGFEF